MTIAEDQKKNLDVSPGASLPAAAPSSSPSVSINSSAVSPTASIPQPAMLEGAPERRSPLRTAGLVTLGLGAAAAAIGVVLATESLTERRQLDSYCGAGSGPQVCDAKYGSLYKHGRALADASTPIFAVAGVALATSLVFVLVGSRSSRSEPKTSLAVGPGGLFVRGQF